MAMHRATLCLRLSGRGTVQKCQNHSQGDAHGCAAGGSYAQPPLLGRTGCAVRGQARRPSPELGQAPPKFTQCGQYCQLRLRLREAGSARKPWAAAGAGSSHSSAATPASRAAASEGAPRGAANMWDSRKWAQA